MTLNNTWASSDSPMSIANASSVSFGAGSGVSAGQLLTAQAILFDKELIPNLKGETDAFLAASERRVQPLNMGINRTFFQYQTLGVGGSVAAPVSGTPFDVYSGAAATLPVQDGFVGTPEVISQVKTSPASLGEWNNFSNFSAFAIASSIDEMVGNSAVELGYQCGQAISEIYSETADSAATVDPLVNQSGLLSSPFTLDLATYRELKQQMVSKNILPCKKGKFMGVVSPNVLGDIYNATTVNNSIVDQWKHTDAGMAKFDKIAGSDQKAEIELPGTNIVIRQTPFVTTIPNYNGYGTAGTANTLASGGSSTSYRSYVFGNFAMIGVWLEVAGDTDLDEGDWRTIKCNVVTDVPPSTFDPTATIGGFASYRFHHTITLPPYISPSGLQRIRWIDSIPAIQ